MSTLEEQKTMEFDKAHEGDDLYICTQDGWVLYSDGARRSTKSWDTLGHEVAEPPTDPKELRRWQIVFWETRLQQLVAAFEDTKAHAAGAVIDEARFAKRMQELKSLKSKVASARSKLSHLVTEQKGYTGADVQRAWDIWERFVVAVREESVAKQRYESALLGVSSPGKLERLKFAYDQAKAAATEAMERWNSFNPQARSIVNEQLDANARQQRETELAQIEV